MASETTIIACVAAVLFGVLPWALAAPFADHFKLFQQRKSLNPPGWPISLAVTFVWEMAQIASGIAAYVIYSNENETSSSVTGLFVSTYGLVATWLIVYAAEIKYKFHSFLTSRFIVLTYCTLANTLLALLINNDATSLSIGLWAIVCLGKTLDLYWVFLTIKSTPVFTQ